MDQIIAIRLLPFLKGEEEILDLMYEFDKVPVFQKGVTLLKKERNIVGVIVAAKGDDAVCEAAITSLGLENKSDDEILGILSRTSYPEYLSFAAIKYLKNEKNILAVAEKSNYKKNIVIEGVKYLKSYGGIISLVKAAVFDQDVCKTAATALDFESMTDNEILYIFDKLPDIIIQMAGIKHLSFREIILFLMKKRDLWLDKLWVAAVPALDAGFRELNETTIMSVLEEVKYKEEACVAALPYLTTEYNIVKVVNKCCGISVKVAAIKPFNFKEKKSSQILKILSDCQYSPCLSKEAIQYMDDADKVMLLKRVYDGYHEEDCGALFKEIEKFSSPDHVLAVCEYTKFCISATEGAANFLLRYFEAKPEKKIIKFLSPVAGKHPIEILFRKDSLKSRFFKKVVDRLKNLENVMAVMEHLGQSSEAWPRALNLFNFEGMAQEEILKILKKMRYRKDLCEKASPFLDFTGNTRKGLLLVLKEVKESETLSHLILPLLDFGGETVEEIIGEIEMVDYYEPVIHRAILDLDFRGKTTEEIVGIMQRVGYHRDICSEAMDSLDLKEKSQEEILGIMKEVDYNTYICEVLLNELESR